MYLQRLFNSFKELKVLRGLEVLLLYFTFGDVHAFSFVWPKLDAITSTLFYCNL